MDPDPNTYTLSFGPWLTELSCSGDFRFLLCWEEDVTGADSTLIWVCEDLRGLCFVVVDGFMTEFCDVEGARGWDALRDVAVVVVLVVDGALFPDFSLMDGLRLTFVRGAIQRAWRRCINVVMLIMCDFKVRRVSEGSMAGEVLFVGFAFFVDVISSCELM
jgi:hypothetical protein